MKISSGFRPLIRGFFFYESLPFPHISAGNSFRPLIRGFFFYVATLEHGIQLMYSFRPLIRGFFFYVAQKVIRKARRITVSVPSFGDSFFI